MPYLMIFQNTYIAVPFGELHFENKHVMTLKIFQPTFNKTIFPWYDLCLTSES